MAEQEAFADFQWDFRNSPSSSRGLYGVFGTAEVQETAHVAMRGWPWPKSPYLSVYAGCLSGSGVAIPESSQSPGSAESCRRSLPMRDQEWGDQSQFSWRMTAQRGAAGFW